MKKTILSFIFGIALIFNAGASNIVASANSGPAEFIDVLIGFENVPGPSERSLVQRAGGEIKYSYTLVPAIAAKVPSAALRGLERNPLVTVIEPDGIFWATDYQIELDNTWGVKRIQAGVVHKNNNFGTGIKVAVIDTGIDCTHSELNCAGGWNFITDSKNYQDDNGHGTHVAGTIAAARNGVGVVGASPEVQLYALKVLGKDGSGSFSDVIKAIEWCVDKGIQVTNNSYGSSGDPGTLVKKAFDESFAAGVLHVSSAGNSGNPPGTGDSVGYPAKYSSVIAVAASDSNDKRARWSSTGPDVELIAPGVSIRSTLPDNKYGTYSGTSMASPHVAGVAALVMAAGKTNNTEVRRVLRDTAEDLGLSFNHQGYGLVRADLAVGADPAPEPDPDPDPDPESGDLSIDTFDLTNTSNPAWARVSVEWAVSGTNLASVKTEMKFDGKLVDSRTSSVSGSSASGTHELRSRGGHGKTYDITLTVTDVNGTIQEIKSISL